MSRSEPNVPASARPPMDPVAIIRDRRERTVGRALTLLELYPAADPATRASLLRTAAPALADPRVAGRWITLLAREADPGLRVRLLEYLAAHDFRLSPETADWVAPLLSCAAQPEARHWALAALAAFAPHDARVLAPLMDLYGNLRDVADQRRVLRLLLAHGDPPPALVEFLLARLESVDAHLKVAIVRRLLEQDAIPAPALARLLAPTEPTAIKVLVLDHLLDRSIRLPAATLSLLRQDPDASVRMSAAYVLLESECADPAVLEALLSVVARDPDAQVRSAVLAALHQSLARTPAVIRTILALLPQEPSTEQAIAILRLIEPAMGADSGIAGTLRTMLSGRLQIQLAVEVLRILGALSTRSPELVAWLAEEAARTTDDRIKVAILRPLSQLGGKHPELAGLYADAIRLPDLEIQRWGAYGIVQLPATADHTGAFEAAAARLSGPGLPADLTRSLARKLTMLPEKSAALRSHLQAAAAQSGEPEVRRLCEEACSAETTDAMDPLEVAIDWSSWIHRAEVEHRADGIFPALYGRCQENPAAARRILKALLNPQCSSSLYASYGYQVNEASLLDCLDRMNAIDDEVSRFCIGRVLTQDYGTPAHLLEYLDANPGFAGLRDGLWRILAKRPDAAPAQMRHLLVVAHGGDAPAAAALAARIAATRGAEALMPSVKLVQENLGWPPAPDLLRALWRHPDLTGDARVAVQQAMVECEIDDPQADGPKAVAPGPGFADE